MTFVICYLNVTKRLHKSMLFNFMVLTIIAHLLNMPICSLCLFCSFAHLSICSFCSVCSFVHYDLYAIAHLIMLLICSLSDTMAFSSRLSGTHTWLGLVLLMNCRSLCQHRLSPAIEQNSLHELNQDWRNLSTHCAKLRN